MPTSGSYAQDLFDLIDGDTEDGLGAILEPIRQHLCNLVVTVITMYRAHDAEMFTQVIEGELTAEQRDEWRKVHFCDQHSGKDEDDWDGINNMFFRVIRVRAPETGTATMVNVDGEGATVEQADAIINDDGDDA